MRGAQQAGCAQGDRRARSGPPLRLRPRRRGTRGGDVKGAGRGAVWGCGVSAGTGNLSVGRRRAATLGRPPWGAGRCAVGAPGK